MRRVILAILFAFAGSARLAHAAAISVAGAECGTPPLLGLTLTVDATGTNIGTACPSNSVGQIFGDTGSGDSGPLYGSPITSIEFSVSDLSQLGNLEIITDTSAFDQFSLTATGFRLYGGNGILACMPTPVAVTSCFSDAVVTFRGFTPGTTLEVTAVNDHVIPEPATGALLLSGFSAALLRRRARRLPKR